MSKLDTATSLYLRLHKDNPVAWRLWGPEALAEAEAQNKPIFLSMGYTACHWCHVMNGESFSDPQTAKLLNDNFIPVLVDREDRPDLDIIYQAASQTMGHSGGWPLNVFLTPKGLPYFVTGYLPKIERPGQLPFAKVVADAAAQYRDQPELVAQNSAAILQNLETLYSRNMRGAPESIGMDSAAIRIGQRFDVFSGGLLGAMKFPSVTQLEVLWRAFLRSGASQFHLLVTTSLDGMLLGGLYDHVGGGFFRYTVDERWQIPHFEKMLYDNAQLIQFLTGIWQFNRNELCRQRVVETVDWLLREMKLGDGFAAGVDADSEGEEGKYYLWSEAEIDAALAGTFSARFKQIYGVTHDGILRGRNVLRRAPTAMQLSPADEALLGTQRGLLLAARAKRVAPLRDDKLMTDWNGLMIGALGFAGVVFERPDWIAAAIAAYDYVRKVSGEGERLYHNFTDGKRGEPGFADDYAQMARAALQLWEITGDARFLDDAKAWTRTLDSEFWNDELGGYNYVANTADPLIIRARMMYDQPTPSANGTMITVLIRLALITGRADYGNRAQQLLASFADEINRNQVPCAEMLNGMECLANALQIVVLGARNNSRTQELIRAVWGKALPSRLLVVAETGEHLPEGHPVRAKPLQNGQPTVYICQRNVASPPITSAVTLSQALTLPPQAQQQRPG